MIQIMVKLAVLVDVACNFDNEKRHSTTFQRNKAIEGGERNYYSGSLLSKTLDAATRGLCW